MTAPTALSPTQQGKNLILEAIRIRRETDDIMSGLWILSPLLGSVAFVAILFAGTFIAGASSGSRVGALAGGFVGLILGTIVYIIIALLPWYKLIRRRSEHFKRDRILREGLISYIRGAASERGIEGQMSTELATMNTVHSESNGEEDEKSAMLWIILSVITFGLLGLYVSYFLTKDPHHHDIRQLAFMQQVQSAFSKLQKTIVFPFWKAIPDRSFFLYLILSVLTLGLFALYWNYVLISDFNQHFKAQWQIEDQLVPNL
jgi:hypothetical protein